MRIVWLTKRRYMGGDLLEGYGRYWELPTRLAQRGYEITLIAASYNATGVVRQTPSPHLSVLCMGLSGIGSWLRAINNPADIVVGSSDMHFCMLSVLLARRHRRHSICDVYDNFETYQSARFPGIVPRYYSALARSTRVVASDPLLADYLRDKTGRSGVEVQANGYDPDVFKPLDKIECRREFNLGATDKVITYAGNITRQRGISVLLDAYKRLRQTWPNLRLMLAGPLQDGLNLSDQGITYLGRVPQTTVARLLNASDVAVGCMADESLGKFWHPVKLIEYAACGTPYVVAARGSCVRLLSDHPESLFDADDADGLCHTIDVFLRNPPENQPRFADWDAAAENYSKIIETVRAQ